MRKRRKKFTAPAAQDNAAPSVAADDTAAENASVTVAEGIMEFAAAETVAEGNAAGIFEENTPEPTTPCSENADRFGAESEIAEEVSAASDPVEASEETAEEERAENVSYDEDIAAESDLTDAENGDMGTENSDMGVEKSKKRGGVRGWFSRHMPTKRRLIQLYTALLYNANIKGFVSGTFYQGQVKRLCVPGLNCYSCPGAAAACPLGALQNAFAESGTRAPYYVIGIILLFGIILGRTICGFLCPVGLGQELLYKIKTPKLKKNRVTRVLSLFKYVILAVLVVIVPMMYALRNTPLPAFCKFICPAGTFGGAIALLIHPSNSGLFAELGGLFTWKFCVLIAVIVACVFIYRAFCRFLCPLGALYGLFNRFAILGIKLDGDKCTHCGKCVAHCKMDVRRVGDRECIDCGECIGVCSAKAITWKGSSIFLKDNELAPVTTERSPLIPVAAGAGASGVTISADVAAVTSGAADFGGGGAVGSASASDGAKKKARSGRGRALWLKVAAAVAAIALLVTALVYYNFIDKDPSAVVPNEQVDRGSAVGDLCYDFTVDSYTAESGKFTLSEHLGKIVIINFWGTWCTPCVEELPYFQKILDNYEGVEVVAIHSAGPSRDVVQYLVETRDALDPSRTWADWDVEFAQDSGKNQTSSDVYRLLGGRNNSYPMTLIVDAEGIIRFRPSGSVTYEMLAEQIELILGA